MAIGIGIGAGFMAAPSPVAAYGVGSWVPALVLDFARGLFVAAPAPSVTRPGSATVTLGDGTVVSVAQDTLRYDFRGAGGLLNGAARWLLVEGGAIRLNGYLSIRSGTAANDSATLTDRSDAALGQFGGCTIASTGANWNRANTPYLVLTSGTAYAVKILYAAGTSGRARIVLRNEVAATESNINGVVGALAVSTTAAGTVTIRRDTAIGGGLRELVLIFTPNGTGNHRVGLGPDSATAGQTIIGYAWQIEAGSTDTSYMLGDTGAQQARSQDAVAAIDLTGKVGTSLGVVLDCYLDGVVGTVDRLVQLDAGSDTGARVGVVYNAGGILVVVYNAAGSQQVSLTVPVTLPSRVKLALRYSLNQVQVVCNGVASAIDITAEFIAPQYARLGSAASGGNRPARMGVGQLLIGPAMTEAEAIILGAAA